MKSEIIIPPTESRTSSATTKLAAAEKRRKSATLVVALVGPPGAGKTALLEATLRQLRGKARVAVVAVNPAAERDADRVSRYCQHSRAVTTATPDSPWVRAALGRIDLSRTDILFIESLGGIAGVPELGQDVTVTVLAVSGGDDKAAEYGQLLSRSPVLVLTKSDLKRHVRFDLGVFRADVRRINPEAELMEVSAFDNTGLNRWLSWIERQRQLKDPRHEPLIPRATSEWFLG